MKLQGLALLLPLALAGCASGPGGNAPADAGTSRRDSPDTRAPGGRSDDPVKVTPRWVPSTGKGGYYKDDGPADVTPANLAAIPDAEPKWEPLHRFANRPYTVLGRTYTPGTSVKTYKQRGIGSWYGKKFHGQRTSIGETYDMFAMTAAHPTLPIPSYVRVTHVQNKRSVIVRVNDRGPFHPDRIIDLSYVAAWKLGYNNAGSAEVEIESVWPGNLGDTKYADVAPPTTGSGPTAPPADLQKSGAAAGAGDLDAFIAALERPEQPERVAERSAPRGVFLQLGAFGNPDNADAFRGQMERSLDWMKEPIRIFAAESVQRVQAGPFASRAAAEKAAERIREQMGGKATIVQR